MKAALSFHPIAGDYDFIGEFREGRALVRNNIAEFRVGYIDKEGRVAVPLEYIGRFEREAGHPVFVHFPFFSDGLAVLMRKDGRFGAVDPSGGMAVPFIYDSLTYFYGGLVEAQKDGKWGFLDKEGHAAIPLLYDRVGTFSEGLAAAEKNGKWGFLDPEGHIVLPFEYDSTVGEGFSDGLVPVRRNGREGYMDKTRRMAILLDPGYAAVCGVHSGFALVAADPASSRKAGNGAAANPARKPPLYGAIDRAGRIVVPAEYASVRILDGGFVTTGLDGRKRFLDPDGQTVLAADFEEMGDFSEGLAAIKRDGAYGYADKTGQVVIPCAYSAAGGFHEGYAAVRKDGRYGYIDRTGATVVPFIYDTAARFCDGAAAVRKDGGWGIWQIETRGG